MGNLLSLFMDQQQQQQQQQNDSDDQYLLATTSTKKRDFLAALRDPRSPALSFRRTPLASGGNKLKQQYAFDSDPSIDPRSPTFSFKRTPLAQGVIDYNDPRSPMANRTPVARLLFNVNDPREPAMNRTPLSSLACNSTTAAKQHRTNRRLIDDTLCDADADDSMCSFGSLDDNDDDNDNNNGCNDERFEDTFVDIPLEDDELPSDEVQINDESEELCDDSWQMPIAKPARYMLLTPKLSSSSSSSSSRNASRLSLCAVKSAVANAMAASSPLASFASKPSLALSLQQVSLDDSFSSITNEPTIGALIGATVSTTSTKRDAPPSPFAVLKAAGLRTTPLASQRRASCPSSPAA